MCRVLANNNILMALRINTCKPIQLLYCSKPNNHHNNNNNKRISCFCLFVCTFHTNTLWKPRQRLFHLLLLSCQPLNLNPLLLTLFLQNLALGISGMWLSCFNLIIFNFNVLCFFLIIKKGEGFLISHLFCPPSCSS